MKFIKYTTYLQTAILILLVQCLFQEASASLDPYAILFNYYEAIGGLKRLQAIKSGYSEGTILYDGLQGQVRSWYERPLRYRSEEDYGIIAHVEGDDGFQTWFQDTNGQVLVYRDQDTLKRRMVRALLEDYEHLKRNSPWFSLKFQGVRPVNGRECLVVEMTNSINSDVTWYFFDAETSLLVTTIERQPDMEVQTVFSDYRWSHGIYTPFRTESHIRPRDKRIVVELSRNEFNIDYEPTHFSVPQGLKDSVFEQANMAKDIPFELVEDSICLPVTIAGDTRPWIVDSGASGTVIDADYARSLGLEPQTGIRGFGFGEHFDLAFVRTQGYGIKGVQVGPQTILAVKGLQERFDEPKIAGILGYDFLSRFVVKIDYARQLISFYEPLNFSYEGDGVILNAPLKYNTFSLPVVLNGEYEGMFSLDTGAASASIYYKFAKKYGLLHKRGIKRAASGLNGAFVRKEVRFATVQIGGLSIPNAMLAVHLEPGKGMDASGELAGNLGNSILRHFVVYLDYARQRVILEKGPWFYRRFKADQTGVTVGIDAEGMPMVSYVDETSPGFRAGLRTGDRFVAINGIRVHKGMASVVKEVLLTWPEKAVRIGVQRGTRRLTCYLRK
jgi:hypothetical protein